MSARGGLFLGLAMVAALLLLGRAATALVVDHAWFTAMGLPELFWEQVMDTAALRGGAWAVGALFAFANLHAVRRTIVAVAVPSRVANLELVSMISGQRLLAFTVLLAMVLGGALAMPLTNWVDLALLRHGLPFGEIEGVLGRDLGFYVYWLPVEETLYLWALVSVVSCTALVVILYALTRSLRMEGRRVAASTHVRRHLSALGAMVLLLLAWSYRLDAFDLLQQGSGPDGLFVKIDHRVALRMDHVLSVGSAIAAMVVLRTGWVGQVRAAFLTLTLILVAALGLRHAAPMVLARTSLLGDPTTRDFDYIASRALYSRRAFDVDGIRFVDADSSVTRLERATLPVRMSLWDRRSVAAAMPVARAGVDGPRATVPLSGDLVPMSWTVMDDRLSALVVRRPADGAGDWRVSVFDATAQTLLDRPEEASERPERTAVLVGPGLRDPLLVDATRSPQVVGVSLASLRARIAHAWALRDLSLLRADSVRAEPLLLSHRDVRDRVARLAPAFAQANEVLPLRYEGRVFWTLHLYSVSDRYPLSQHWQFASGVYSYYRLAATAVIEAAAGRVRLVAAPRADAPTRTWMARFPTLFAQAGELPAAILAQLPPANESAVAQIETFARYGLPRERSVLRHLPDSALIGGAPAPHWIGNAGERRVAWSVPLIDGGDQISGIVTVAGGQDRQTWWDSTSSPRNRWRTMTERLQIAIDSMQRAVGDGSRRGSRGQAGRVSAVMTADGVLLLQPLLGAQDDGSTTVLRVATTDGRRVGVGATVGEALGQFNDVPVATGPSVIAGGRQDSSDAARRWYATLRSALRRGDWVQFGAAFDSLGRVLERPPL